MLTWQIKIGMLLVLLAGVMGLYALGYSNGADNVRQKWNIDIAKREAVAEDRKARNLKTIVELNEDWERRMEYAKTKAARDAVNRYLHDIGVLPARHEMRDCGSPSSADSTGLPDAGREEQGTSTSLEGFAINCADDASRLTDWQTLCKSQGCLVSE